MSTHRSGTGHALLLLKHHPCFPDCLTIALLMSVFQQACTGGNGGAGVRLGPWAKRPIGPEPALTATAAGGAEGPRHRGRRGHAGGCTALQVSPPSMYKSPSSREGTYAIDRYTSTTACAYQPQVESRRMYVTDCLTMAMKPLLLQQAAPPRVYLRLCLNTMLLICTYLRLCLHTMLLRGLACLGLCPAPSAVLSSYYLHTYLRPYPTNVGIGRACLGLYPRLPAVLHSHPPPSSHIVTYETVHFINVGVGLGGIKLRPVCLACSSFSPSRHHTYLLTKPYTSTLS